MAVSYTEYQASGSH